MDVYKTPGAFSWNELMTTDPAAAGAFYAGLFGWAMKNMDMGTGPYHVASIGDTQVAGIMGMVPGGPPMPPAWGCYITVDNVDETLAKCTALGGQTLVDLIVEHSHTCYLGDREHRHAWGYGCGSCPACELRARGWRGFHPMEVTP